MAFAFPILIGDIGGTNARFAVVPDGSSPAIQFPIVQTKNFETIDDAIAGSSGQTNRVGGYQDINNRRAARAAS